MMRTRSFVAPDAKAEGGMTLVEVIVAMMIFAILVIGVTFSMTSVLSLTEDSQARVAASNLASTAIDKARSIEDVFDVLNEDTTETVNGRVYTIKRVTSWVSDTGADLSCRSSGGALQYKRVNVTVTWTGSKTEVHADTILTPGTRINDPQTGTITISVTRASGTGFKDATVTATPVGGGAAITTAPDTDADGCSYILDVPEGEYNVKVEEAGAIASSQTTDTTTALAKVEKGKSSAVSFAFDTPSTVSLSYVPMPTPAVAISGAVLRPTAFDVTFLSTYAPYTKASAGSSVKLFPWSSGYQAIAGKYAAEGTQHPCTVGDPAAWDDLVAPAPAPVKIGARLPSAAAAPGGTAALQVPVGVLNVKTDNSGSGSSNRQLWATLQTDTPPGVPPVGQPTCVTAGTNAVTYSFGAVLPKGDSSSINIALPYGSWKLFWAVGASDAKLAVDASRITILTAGTPANSSTKIVTLDPRRVP